MFSNTEKNVYPFCYRAFVVDNDDPKKLGRVTLRVPEVFGANLVTDWAFAKIGAIGSIGDNQKGEFKVPDKGDTVWCEFESGNPNYPVWTGVWYADNYKPPQLALGTPDNTVVDVVHATGTAKDPYKAQYPFDRVIKTKSGHTIELDDTTDNERIKIYHSSGTFVDIDHSGNVRIKVIGNIYTEVNGDVSERIHGNVTRIVEGNNNLRVVGVETRESDTHIVDNAPRIDHN